MTESKQHWLNDVYQKSNRRLRASNAELLKAATDFVESIDSHPQDYELDTKAHGLAVCLNTHKGEMLRTAIAKVKAREGTS